jgi:hypothetical protein
LTEKFLPELQRRAGLFCNLAGKTDKRRPFIAMVNTPAWANIDMGSRTAPTHQFLPKCGNDFCTARNGTAPAFPLPRRDADEESQGWIVIQNGTPPD